MTRLALICIFLLIACGRSDFNANKTDFSSNNSVLDYVDPNIGTAHSRWFFYTPAALPFGMAKLGPSTNGSYGNEHGWEAVGYDPRHTSIEGFANLHEFQIGGFLFTAMTGDLKTIPGTLEDPDEGYRSRFDKKDELAQPGYYRVKLKDYDITAELTATKRVGFQRYTFPKSQNSYIILDIGNQLGESGEVVDASISFKPDNIFEGWVITLPKYVQKYQPNEKVKMFFSGKINKDPEFVGTFKGKIQHKDQNSISGKGAGLYMKFETQVNDTLEIKTGFSYTSVENARLNLEEEATNLNFRQALAKAQQIWSNELNKIKITDSSFQNKQKFYTGLYHALLGRGLANDVNGDFPQNDGTIGEIPKDENGKLKFSFYNTDAIWGGFWNLTQLWTLGWPKYYNDFVQSHLMVYKNSGWLGDGLANSKFVSGVGTNFVGLVIASAYQAGIRDFNAELAFEAAYKNEIEYKNREQGAGKTDLKGFVEQGYVPYKEKGWNSAEGSRFSASHTLEYAYSSYAVAQFAKALGKEKEYRELMQLSTNWKNLYDDKTDFIRPRMQNGEFLQDFDPFAPWIGFQEGNAWQYSFYVPHNPHGLIAKMGEVKFIKRLDSIFTVSEKTEFGGKEIDAFSGINYIYNQGNQPSLYIPWLFNFTQAPWLTQKWVRKICNEFYGNDDVHGYGYGQDEDQGQLGAWYVMSSIGLFDVKGLVEINPSFQLGSPLFDRIKIATGNNKFVVIETSDNEPGNYYIQSVKVNGQNLDENHIGLEQLKTGANIKIELGNKPNKNIFQKKIN